MTNVVTVWQQGDPARVQPADPLWGGVTGIVVDTSGGGVLLAVDRDEETGRLVTVPVLTDELEAVR